MLALRLSGSAWQAGSSDRGAGGEDRDVGVLDLVRHGLLERGDALVDLGDVNPGSKLSTISTKTTRPERLDLTRSSR
jgi:hypothetical protein